MNAHDKTKLFETAREQIKLTHLIAEGMKESPTSSLGAASNLVLQTSRCAAAALAFEEAMRGVIPPSKGLP